MLYYAYCTILFLITTLAAFASPSVSDLTSIQTRSNMSLPKVRGSAGCLLKKDGFLLAVTTVESGKWDIPSGKAEGDETADQTAVRETLEETGIAVEAVRLLENFDNEFYVYECRIKDRSDTDIERKLVIPATAAGEIAEIAFISIDTLTPANTRYPSVLPRIRALFKNLP